ncbi:Flp pilus assembly protein, secretin CpaC [Gloeobacter kilaueensis JS1]|uniref:Flp pilus assembly protein, secretin CpaC n=1 Tax=Gloeobacter kilaueensis (strain ATCC BAA-2537 / CCAP 1431/1 / ULC 316 / JS1) TaxID=1183438 RepID=U5QIU0_GLOK1|nr:Flp pilus assembly protein, secretin CpaC [Gloeobacter kilaueensis JS1]
MFIKSLIAFSFIAGLYALPALAQTTPAPAPSTPQPSTPPVSRDERAIQGVNKSNQQITFSVKIFELPATAVPTTDDAVSWLKLANALAGEGRAAQLVDSRLVILSGEKGFSFVANDLRTELSNSGYTSVNADATVELEPVVRPDGKIVSRLSFEGSVPESGGGRYPNLSRQKIRTTLLLNNGQLYRLQNFFTPAGNNGLQRWLLFITASL